ncbi:hypothetical protein Acsp03_62030 [Actinomadura sp. NBRC 104412]|uniref:helix-turn-helix domain-containing protein n=1 Tax=Actinomadura sp. NBRC 104412 TaxID=3032203 RepID=UPI0024A1C9F1|nr:helix-turn-helix transcriptional regulator [Actinomadura sp. NBRC 104412]GLZ08737.1 hypothetical protein Acsp03_62030 [Actinomadura sp. NBRC 104412]
MTPDQQRARGHRIAAERKALGLTQLELAERVLGALPGPQKPELDTMLGYVKRWEAGRAGISRRHQRALAQALQIDQLALFGEGPNGPSEEFNDERRQLLAGLAALSVESAVPHDLEPIRQALTRALPGGMSKHLVADWEEIAYEHGHAFLTTPPRLMLPTLAQDLVHLQHIIRDTKGTGLRSLRQSLSGPAAKLAALVAMTVATLGDPRQARDWWKTARHTADASTDLNLRVWVRGHEAMSALYSLRPIPLVLRLADEAIGLAGESGGAAMMEAMASRAQALAILGRAAEAENVIHELETQFARLPQAPVEDRLRTGAWPETGLHHTAAFTYSYTGSYPLAERAQEAALALYPETMPRQRAQIELLRAKCLIGSGDVATGVEHAARTVQALPLEQRTTTIRRGARMVLEAVPEADRVALGEYREVLALPAAIDGGE